MTEADALLAKLDRLLHLSQELGYQDHAPRQIDFGALAEFTRLHAELLGLALLGLELNTLHALLDQLARQVAECHALLKERP